MRKTSEYAQMGQHVLVRRPHRRAIRVILLGAFHHLGTDYLQQIAREEALANHAADAAHRRGWKTIIVEPGMINPHSCIGCNIAGHLAAHGFNKNEVCLGYINDLA